MDNIYQNLDTLLKQGHDMVLITVIKKEGSGPVDVAKKMLIVDDGITYGTIGGGSLENFAISRAREVLNSRTSMEENYLLSDDKEIQIVKEDIKLNMACGGKVTLFYEFIGPRQTIYIFGGGHCGKALVNILKTIGVYIVVIDPRKEILDDIIGVDEKVQLPFEDYLTTHKLKNNSMVVVATPSHEYDFQVLNKIIMDKIPLKYLGMLCSTKKITEYISNLKIDESQRALLKNLYAPVGLDFGTSKPEDIAISIASEILLIISNKSEPRHMRDRLIGQLEYWKQF